MNKILKGILGTTITLGAVATLAACGGKTTTKKENKTSSKTTQADKTNAKTTTQANKTTKANVTTAKQGENVSTKNLSASTYNVDKEYYYEEYNRLSEVKVFNDKNSIVYKTVSYEELIYLLESDGNHLILFGGSWCHNTRAAIGYINDYANEYGIDTIYNFDFRLDSTTRDTHIRETNNNTETAPKGVAYNYLYGELISKYLTNLNDWVEYKEDTKSALTYTNKDEEDVTVAKAQVPFLFLYNKDNTTNNSTNTTSTETSFPIVYGFEEMVDRDKDGVYTQNYETKEKTYITDDYLDRLEGIFKYIQTNDVKLAKYTTADYILEAFNEKSGKELFAKTDKINYETLSYKQLTWLLEQEGDAIILLGGSWCGNTQAIINIVNDYAVANEVTVYLYDTKIDSGIGKTRFEYTNDTNTRSSNGPLVSLYANLIEQYFTNIETLYDSTDGVAGHKIEYTNASGEVVAVAKAQVPFLLSYNKDSVDELGLPSPIKASLEVMLTLVDDRADYVYEETNYKNYTDGIKNVLKTVIEDVKEITKKA